jgi:predicted ATP-dependent serine protease
MAKKSSSSPKAIPSAKRKRIKTGVKGFDSSVQGGLKANSVALVVGGAGVEKLFSRCNI